ncbi:hypothetical protein [Bacillus haynesii]|nr:hypothetical protein [Bacillus haynesii]
MLARLDIAVETIEYNTLTIDGTIKLVLADARRKSLRKDAITYRP